MCTDDSDKVWGGARFRDGRWEAGATDGLTQLLSDDESISSIASAVFAAHPSEGTPNIHIEILCCLRTNCHLSHTENQWTTARSRVKQWILEHREGLEEEDAEEESLTQSSAETPRKRRRKSKARTRSSQLALVRSRQLKQMKAREVS